MTERDQRGPNLKAYLRQAGLTATELAKACGVTPQSVNYWFQRGVPPKHAAFVAKWVGISDASEISDVVPPTFRNELSPDHPLFANTPRESPYAAQDGYTYIGKSSLRAAMGDGDDLAEYEQVVDNLAFKTDWIIRKGLDPSQLGLISCRGDSMSPTLEDGDLVLVDLSLRHLWDDGIYAIRVDGSIRVKRVRAKLDGSIEVSSDNDKYPSETFTAEEGRELHSIGPVIWVARELR